MKTQNGGYYGGWQVGGMLGPSWTLSSYLTLKLEYNWSHVKVSKGIYDVHVARFRIQSALSPKISANAFIQYNSDIREISAHLRIRYNPREGVDLYIVYNEGLNTDLDWKIPRLPRSNGRALLFKYSYTFIK